MQETRVNIQICEAVEAESTASRRTSPASLFLQLLLSSQDEKVTDIRSTSKAVYLLESRTSFGVELALKLFVVWIFREVVGMSG
jgi:hypothetical protein